MHQCIFFKPKTTFSFEPLTDANLRFGSNPGLILSKVDSCGRAPGQFQDYLMSPQRSWLVPRIFFLLLFFRDMKLVPAPMPDEPLAQWSGGVGTVWFVTFANNINAHTTHAQRTPDRLDCHFDVHWVWGRGWSLVNFQKNCGGNGLFEKEDDGESCPLALTDAILFGRTPESWPRDLREFVWDLFYSHGRWQVVSFIEIFAQFLWKFVTRILLILWNIGLSLELDSGDG